KPVIPDYGWIIFGVMVMGQALEMAEDSHDADIGQEHLRYAIDAVKRT
ncbi:hypothetical protein IAE50_22720, partial [Kosakonia sp. S42]|nr:hypothetical protein [Kosakonia sp. S42]